MEITSNIDFRTDEQLQITESVETLTENFQYKKRYIITGLKSGMLMIEQHRAHIRILFDLFMSQIENHKALSQQVLFPDVLELNADDALIFEQLLPDLKLHGFDFETSGNYSYHVKGVPDLLGTGSVIDLLLSMLDKAKTTAEELTNDMHETISLSLAEASAIKAGQRLTNEEMNDLIDRLFASPNHNFTPDGKKIMTILTHEEIEKRF
jgi:DNA mismatch repair protein MutL